MHHKEESQPSFESIPCRQKIYEEFNRYDNINNKYNNALRKPNTLRLNKQRNKLSSVRMWRLWGADHVPKSCDREAKPTAKLKYVSRGGHVNYGNKETDVQLREALKKRQKKFKYFPPLEVKNT